MARKPTPEERVFALGVAAGARRGRQVEQEQAIRDVAAGLLAEDVTEAVGLFKRHGNRALSYIASAARTVWPEKWRTALGPLILRVMRSAELTTDRGPVTLGFDVKSPKLAAYFEDYMTQLSGGVTETTAQQVTDAIREGLDGGEDIPQITRRVREAGEEFTDYRSRLIARDQTLKASRGSSYMQAVQSGIVKTKTHRYTKDARTRLEHRFEETVGIDEPYQNGEIIAGSLSVSCRCYDEFGIDMDALKGRAA